MNPRPVRVGDQVTFRLGLVRCDGKVVADLGRVGVNGRRMVRVQFDMHGSASTIELPARDLDSKEPV